MRIMHVMTDTPENKLIDESEEIDETQVSADDDVSNDDHGSTRQRSTIVFPYGSLQDAEKIAKEVHGKWGGHASPDQLAAGMDTSPRSGTFRVKLATARIFGVVQTKRSLVEITDLGRRLVDPQKAAAARVEAFLGVPLFKEIYESHRGASLPPGSALENEMVRLGVSAKQKDRARQAFQRSAEQAGFFDHGRDRLIMPPELETSAGPRGDEDNTNVGIPDAVTALWLTLLRDGASWSPQRTHRYVQAARELRNALSEDAAS
jgi:hypothetical protein